MPALSALRLQLAEFEGPLPLLLHLIERNELEVTRVSIVTVADQFMALVAAAGTHDLAVTGEFIAAAGRLLLIKSRALLRTHILPTNDDEPDDAEALARQIAEYRLFQHAARRLAALREDDALAVPRIAPAISAAIPPQVPPVIPAVLRRAALRLLRETEPAIPLPATGWPQVDYALLRAELLTQLRCLRETSFAYLCRDAWHPLVVVTLFLAVLDTVRSHAVEVWQDTPYGPIRVALQADAPYDA